MLVNINTLDMVLVLIQKIAFYMQIKTYGVNVIIFGCDLSSSIHANNKINRISLLSKISTSVNETAIYTEKIIEIILLLLVKKLFLVYITMEIIVICL